MDPLKYFTVTITLRYLLEFTTTHALQPHFDPQLRVYHCKIENAFFLWYKFVCRQGETSQTVRIRSRLISSLSYNQRHSALSCLELGKIRSLASSLTKYCPAAVFTSYSHICTQMQHTHILSVLDKHRHSWFVPHFQDSAYSNRIEPFFFSAHFSCVCVCAMRVSCRLCSIVHVSMTGPLT